MSSDKVTRTCTSPGCDRPTRKRPFKKSVKLYYESVCRACQGTLRRYGITAPERDRRKQMGVDLGPPSGAPGPKRKDFKRVKSNVD